VWLPVVLLLLGAAQAPQREPPVTPPAAVPPLMPVAPAALDDSLDITGDSIEAWQLQNRMTVPVMVNDRGPYRFIVDSGADRTAIGLRLATALELPAAAPVVLHGMAGASRTETVRIDRLRVGSSAVEEIVAPVLLERNLGAQGLLGIDALAGQRLMLDFEQHAIVVEDARRPARHSADDIVVTARRFHGQLILTQARAGGVPLSAVIDTGSDITIGNSALHRALFRRARPGMFTPVTMISVTGQPVVGQRTTVREMRLGGIVLRDVPIAFAEVPPFALFGLADTPAMMLGSDVMASFRRVSLDFRAKKVRFQLRRCPPRLAGAAGFSIGRTPGC
jgi:hypothetical protein